LDRKLLNKLSDFPPI